MLNEGIEEAMTQPMRGADRNSQGLRRISDRQALCHALAEGKEATLVMQTVQSRAGGGVEGAPACLLYTSRCV